MFTIPTIERRIYMVLNDFVILAFSMLAVFLCYHLGQHNSLDNILETSISGLSASIFISACYVFCFFLMYMYPFEYKTIHAVKHIFIFFMSSIIVFVTLTILPNIGFRPLIVFLHFPIGLALILMWRFLNSIKNERSKKKILILGAEQAQLVIDAISHQNEIMRVVGILDDDPKYEGQEFGGVKVLGKTEDLQKIVNQGIVDKCVVATRKDMGTELMRTLFDLKLQGIKVYDAPTLFEKLACKIQVMHVEEGWFVNNDIYGLNQNCHYLKIGKRILDIVISSIGLILASPIMLLTAIAIKLESEGPIFYKQVRVGARKKHFKIIKFRSMANDAEKNGAVWASKKDSRVTKVGAFIRKTRIDEIPQMLNVLKGEMSFVGPRPERPEFEKDLEKEIPFFQIRHAVNPGITGWAQVSYPYGASVEDAIQKTQYDLFYIKNLSFFWDIFIILKTIKSVLFIKGSR